MSRSPTASSTSTTELFDQFVAATTLKGVISTFRKICHLLELTPGPFNQFYPSFKKGITGNRLNKNWKAQSIFSKIEKKANNRVYHTGVAATTTGSNGTREQPQAGSHVHHHHHATTPGSSNAANNVLVDHNCLIVGGGPCGLRTAIELQLLGSRHVILIEKRDRFSRNNVLHLWPFVISDLKLLAGKKFYGKFCAGSIDHVSIRQLQLMLLKVALIIGCEIIENITFEEICPQNLAGSLCNKETKAPLTSTTATTGHEKLQQEAAAAAAAVTPKRKCKFAPELAPNQEVDESAEEALDIEEKVQDEVLVESGTSDSEADSDTDELSDSKKKKMEEEEALKARCPGDSTSETKEYNLKDRCECCCHLHRNSSEQLCPKNYLGARAHFSVTSASPATASPYINYSETLDKLHAYQFDVVLGADGRRNLLNENFPRKEFRGRLAIAITANFINTHTMLEAQIPEVSGISSIYNQQLFKTLYDDTGIDLENICYYKDDTHYFVMTAKKSSLLGRGVLYKDFPDTRALLSPDNINRGQLLVYAKDAAKWTTGLDSQNFALNHYGEADVAMFDFTSMYAADNACRAKKVTAMPDVCRNCSCDVQQAPKRQKTGDGKANCVMEEDAVEKSPLESLLLIGLVGDSLLEPFWPTGSGCARGFLSAMDAGWMVRQWAMKQCNINKEEDVLSVLTERESIYRLLGQTKSDNISQNYTAYTLNPITRYPNLNTMTILPHQCKHLLYDDVAPLPYEKRARQSLAAKRLRRATIASASPFENAFSENVVEEAESHVRTVNEKVPGLGESSNHVRVDKFRYSQSREQVEANKELEDSYAAFEENYNGLIGSNSVSSATSSSVASSSTTTFVSSVPNRFNDLTNSPSASNLATLGKSRAKDIEGALRHRRQQQRVFERGSMRQSSLQGTTKTDCVAQVSSLKNKAAWFLEQGNNGTNSSASMSNSSGGLSSSLQSTGFASRIKTLEAKLNAASGLNCLDPMVTVEDCQNVAQQKKLATKGSHVLSTATNLEQLLNPKYQDDKLKKEAAHYRKKTHDIKVISKMTNETDWNKNRWSEIEREAKVSESPPPPELPVPRPKDLVDIFKGKKKEIESKLSEIDSNRRPVSQRTAKPKNKYLAKDERKKVTSGSEESWISLLKDELDTRATSPKQSQHVKSPIKPPVRSPFASVEKRKFLDKKVDTLFSSPSKVCVRCGLQVAQVDRVLLSGELLHRGCLTCSRCSITLRLSEVRNSSLSANSAVLVTTPSNKNEVGVTLGQWNFLCVLCSKNKENGNQRTPTLVQEKSDNKMTMSLDGGRGGSEAVAAVSKKEDAVASLVTQFCAATDDYESKLKERMRWKEQFLLNNNNIDFGPLISRAAVKPSPPKDVAAKSPCDAGKAGTSTSALLEANKINERIEYENTSVSFELYDDDELTKLLNLESDQWESGEEETTSDSESWHRSDSTDNDFDSDEFDASEKEGHHHHRSRRRDNLLREQKLNVTESECLVVPEIVVNLDEEDIATGDEIDTANVLDCSSTQDSSFQSIDADDGSNVFATEDDLDAPKQLKNFIGYAAENKKDANCSKSSSESSDSDTLAEDAMDKKDGLLPVDDKTPTREDLPLLSEDIEDCVEDDEDDLNDDLDETNTSVSSLSCCDVSGTFDDINLVSMVEEEDTTATSLSRHSKQLPKLTTSSRPANCGSNSDHSVLSSHVTPGFVTLNVVQSNKTSTTSNSGHLPASSILVASMNSSNSNATNRQTSFKVAQPKFTVFNFDEYKLPPLSKSPINTTKSQPPSSSATLNPTRTPDTDSLTSMDNEEDEEKRFITSRKPSTTQPNPPLATTSSSNCLSETYSKIPVLASRVAAANQPSSPAVPAYSGSFTEKLLQRCRSTPAMLNSKDPLSKWSFNVNLSSVEKAPYGLTTTQLVKNMTTPVGLRASQTKSFPESAFVPETHFSGSGGAGGGVPFADSDSPTDQSKEPQIVVKVVSSSPTPKQQAVKKAKPLSTVSPPMPFYERLAKELLTSSATASNAKNTAAASRRALQQQKTQQLAPKATFDELFEDEMRETEGHAASKQSSPSIGTDKLHIIESKLKKDKTAPDEQLLRQWFRIKNDEPQ